MSFIKTLSETSFAASHNGTAELDLRTDFRNALAPIVNKEFVRDYRKTLAPVAKSRLDRIQDSVNNAIDNIRKQPVFNAPHPSDKLRRLCIVTSAVALSATIVKACMVGFAAAFLALTPFNIVFLAAVALMLLATIAQLIKIRNNFSRIGLAQNFIRRFLQVAVPVTAPTIVVQEITSAGHKISTLFSRKPRAQG